MRLPIAPPLETSVVVLAFPLEPAPRVLPLDDSMVLGRLGYGGLQDPGPIRLFDDRSSAGRHARLQRTPRGLVVEDLSSANGTFVNRVRASSGPHLLEVGDCVQVGNSLVRFEHRLAAGAASKPHPLLEQVLSSPWDDTVRLVYADWLLERGDPRGEFIRCQLSAAPEAQARAQTLLEVHHLTWLAPLPVPVEQWTFRRGFLDSVRVREPTAAEVLRRFHPLTSIEPLTWERRAL